MLVISRKRNESFLIINKETGEEIRVLLCRSNKQQAALGIEASGNYTILREELSDEIEAVRKNSGKTAVQQ